MTFCEIVYAIYQKKFVINNFKICICQLFHQPQESQDFYICIFFALVNDKENFPA